MASFLDFSKKEHYAKRIKVQNSLPDVHFGVSVTPVTSDPYGSVPLTGVTAQGVTTT